MDVPAREDYFKDDLSSKYEDLGSGLDLHSATTERTGTEKYKSERSSRDAKYPEPSCDPFTTYPNDHHKIVPINAQVTCCKSPRLPSMPPFFYAQKHSSCQDDSASKRFCNRSPILAFGKQKHDKNVVDHNIRSDQIKHAVSHESGCCPNVFTMATEGQILHYRVHRKNNTNMAPMVSLKDKSKQRVLVKKHRKVEKPLKEQSQTPQRQQSPSPAPRSNVPDKFEDAKQSTHQSLESDPPLAKKRSQIEPTQTPPNSRQSSHPSSRPSYPSNRPTNIPDSQPAAGPSNPVSRHPSENQDSRRTVNPQESAPNTRPTSRQVSRPSSRPSSRPDVDQINQPPENYPKPSVPQSYRESRPTSRTTSRVASRENTRPNSPQPGQSYTTQNYPRESANDDQFEATSHDIPQNPTDTSYRQPPDPAKRQASRRGSTESEAGKRDHSAEPAFSTTEEADSSPESKDTTNAVIYGRGFGFLPDRTIVNSRSVSHTRKRAGSGTFEKPVVSSVESQFNDMPAE